MKTTEKRNPALVELILVILFFALSAVILVQVFVKAYMLSQRSRAETLGMVLAEDLLEQWKEIPEQPEQLFSSESGWQEQEAGGEVRTFLAGRGENMEPADSGQAAFEVRTELWAEEREAGELYHIKVQVADLRDGKTLVELETARYVPD